MHYLWTAPNHQPPLDTRARSIQAGQAIHFNATTGFNVYKRPWVGANGYFLKRVTDPLIDGTLSQILRSKSAQSGAVCDNGRFLFYANAYHDIGAENQPGGNKLVLRSDGDCRKAMRRRNLPCRGRS
jgi:hypothetical protein